MANISDLIRGLSCAKDEYGDIKVYFNDTISEKFMAVNSIGVIGARANSETICVLDPDTNDDLMDTRTLDLRSKN